MKVRKGTRKPRVKRPAEKNVPSGYDSIWEAELHQGMLADWQHHKDKVSYTVEHTYHVDFSRTINGVVIYLETKGRFWDFAEYSKYIWIKKCLKPNEELVFLFIDPNKPMPGAKQRADGTIRTHGEWASKHGFRWFSEHSIPDEWISNQYKQELLKEED